MTWHWPLPDRYPLLPDGQGAFGSARTHDVHTGVDLYAPDGHPVVAVEEGTVVAIDPCFTGGAESPWWNQTAAVLVEGRSGVVLYGEVEAAVQVGDAVQAGSTVGVVRQVLRERPGKSYPNPTSMLHLELYAAGARAAVWWRPGEEQPAGLLDPTALLQGVELPADVRPAGVVVLQDEEGRVLLVRR